MFVETIPAAPSNPPRPDDFKRMIVAFPSSAITRRSVAIEKSTTGRLHPYPTCPVTKTTLRFHQHGFLPLVDGTFANTTPPYAALGSWVEAFGRGEAVIETFAAIDTNANALRPRRSCERKESSIRSQHRERAPASAKRNRSITSEDRWGIARKVGLYAALPPNYTDTQHQRKT